MSTAPASPGQILATRLVFFVAGVGMAAWAPLVPFVQQRAALGHGELGLLLLCLGVGSIVAMPLAGLLVAQLGCRRVLVGSVVLMAGALPLLATLSDRTALMASLLVFGAGVGALDCTINIQAVIVERASGRSMMSGFHGLFSLGGIVGAGGVAGLFALGLSPLAATVCVVAVLALAMAVAMPHCLTRGAGRGGPPFAWPRGPVLLIGALCFVVFLAEGAMLDWSAVMLVAAQRVDASHAGLGYAAFAATMTLCRLAGDAVVTRLGPARIVMLGGLCAAAGLSLASLAGSSALALCGYALVGVGCSNIVPVLFSAAGRQTTMPESAAVPAIATLGYAGILCGPAAIGGIAGVGSLAVAFLVVAALLVGVSIAGLRFASPAATAPGR